MGNKIHRHIIIKRNSDDIMTIRYLLNFLILFWSVATFAQSNLSIGQWKSHLSYKEGKRVTQSDKNIIYAADKGMFTISKDDLSVSFISKEDGLTDINISQLYYDKSNKQLIIVYVDNTIDIIKSESEVFNLPFIKQNTSILGSKTINDIFYWCQWRWIYCHGLWSFGSGP
jgi:uncharacterized protein YjiK